MNGDFQTCWSGSGVLLLWRWGRRVEREIICVFAEIKSNKRRNQRDSTWRKLETAANVIHSTLVACLFFFYREASIRRIQNGLENDGHSSRWIFDQVFTKWRGASCVVIAETISKNMDALKLVDYIDHHCLEVQYHIDISSSAWREPVGIYVRPDRKIR